MPKSSAFVAARITYKRHSVTRLKTGTGRAGARPCYAEAMATKTKAAGKKKLPAALVKYEFKKKGK